MAARIFTRCLALVYLLLGLCAFIPRLSGGPSPLAPADMHVALHFERLFWQLPMNYLLAGILIGFGISGLWCSTDTRASRWYARILWTTSLVAVLLGLSPIPFCTILGFVPLYEWMEGVSLMTFILTFYFSFMDGPLPDAASQAVFRQ